DSTIYATIYRDDTGKNNIRTQINLRVKYSDTLSRLIVTKKALDSIYNALNNAKQNNLGFTPEDVANKTDDPGVSSSVSYPSSKALFDALDQVNGDIAGKINYSDSISGQFEPKYRIDSAKVNIRSLITGKEDAFSKGSII